MCDIFQSRPHFVFLRESHNNGNVPRALSQGINETKPEDAKLQLAKLAETIEEKHAELPELSMANFDELITNNPKLVILEIGETWCAPCKHIKPFLHRLQALYKGEIRVISLTQDTNKEAEAVKDRLPKGWYGGTGIPRFGLISRGKHVDGFKGGNNLFTALMEKLKVHAGAIAPEQEKETYLMSSEAFPEHAIEKNAELPKQYQEECFRIAAEKDGLAVIVHYEKIKHFDPDKSYLRKAAFAAIDFEYGGNMVPHSLPVMDNCGTFVHESFAPDVFKLVMKKELGPGDVLENFERYAAEPYALEILGIAASYLPNTFVVWFAGMREKAPPEKQHAMDLLFEEHVRELMDADPNVFALDANFVIEHQFTNGIPNYGLQLLDEMIAKDPVNGIRHPNRWDQLPDAKGRLTSALERTLETRPGAIFQHFDAVFERVQLIDAGDEKRIVLEAARRAPRAAIDPYYTFQGNSDCFSFDEKPYHAEALMVAFQAADQNEPEALFAELENSVKTLGSEYVSSAISKHWNNFPKQVVKNANAILNLPGGNEAFRKACETLLEKDPQALIDNAFVLYTDSPANEPFDEIVKRARQKLGIKEE